MPLAHRETVESQGVEAVLLDVGDGHVELLRAARPGDRRRQVPRAQGPGPAPRRLRGRRHRRDARAGSRAAGIELIDSEPRTGIRGSRVAFLHPTLDRRRADRDRRTAREDH